jgi:hypothetical protein
LLKNLDKGQDESGHDFSRADKILYFSFLSRASAREKPLFEEFFRSLASPQEICA